MSSSKSSTERMRRLTERRKQGIVLPKCKICGSKCTSELSVKTRHCSDCRRKTPIGKQRAVSNARLAVRRQRLIKQHVGDFKESSVNWTSVESSLPTPNFLVLVKTVRNATCLARLNPSEGWQDEVDKKAIRVRFWAKFI